MARPQKQGLNYFSFDVSFFSDIKIRKLIKYYGIQAVPIYEILLCHIYESGYYLEWDDDIPFTISEVSHLEEDYICKVIDFLLDVGLFDKAVYKDYHVLTSRSIQDRYISACSLTKRKVSIDAPYLLIEIKGDKVSSNTTAVNTEQTLFSSEETKVSEEETPENSGKSTQIKEKERKLPPTDTGAPAYAGTGEEPAPYIEPSSLPGVPEQEMRQRLSKAVEELRQSVFWRESVCMKFHDYGLEDKHIDSFLNEFLKDCNANGWVTNGSGNNLKSLFISWLEKRREKKFNNKKQHGNGNYKHETVDQLIQRELIGAKETLKRLDEERRANLRGGVSAEIWDI